MLKTLKISLPITISLFIISLSIITTLEFKGLYYWEIANLSIDQTSHLSKSEIKINYNVLIDYMTNTDIKVLDFPSFGMSEKGKIHFEEVKAIFLLIKKLMILFGIYSILGIILLYRRSYKFLKHAGILTLGIPTITLGLTSINFDRSFIIFHEIVFNNNYWMFDPTIDPIITILPQDFFMHSFFIAISIIIVLALVLFSLYGLLSKQ